jgi:hypothetical protein
VPGIEDSPWGIEAAKKAGVFCVGLTTSYEASRLNEADLIAAGRARFPGIRSKRYSPKAPAHAEPLFRKILLGQDGLHRSTEISSSSSIQDGSRRRRFGGDRHGRIEPIGADDEDRQALRRAPIETLFQKTLFPDVLGVQALEGVRSVTACVSATRAKRRKGIFSGDSGAFFRRSS